MAETITLALAIELGLRLLPVSRLLEWLDRFGQRRVWTAPCPHPRLERFVAAAYRVLPIGPTCLRASLVLYALLRRRGAAPALRLGVRKNGPELMAHAWVECAGVTVDRASFRELHGSPRL